MLQIGELAMKVELLFRDPPLLCADNADFLLEHRLTDRTTSRQSEGPRLGVALLALLTVESR